MTPFPCPSPLTSAVRSAGEEKKRSGDGPNGESGDRRELGAPPADCRRSVPPASRAATAPLRLAALLAPPRRLRAAARRMTTTTRLAPFAWLRSPAGFGRRHSARAARPPAAAPLRPADLPAQPRRIRAAARRKTTTTRLAPSAWLRRPPSRSRMRTGARRCPPRRRRRPRRSRLCKFHLALQGPSTAASSVLLLRSRRLRILCGWNIQTCGSDKVYSFESLIIAGEKT